MKKSWLILSIIFLSIFLNGCLGTKVNKISLVDDKDGIIADRILSPENDVAHISSNDLVGIPKDMVYIDILMKLGKTKDVGSGMHVAKYIVDDKKEVLISFMEATEVCPLSGKDMIKSLKEISLSNENLFLNSYVVSSEDGSAPIYDGKSRRLVGKAYNGFAILLERVELGRAYFSLTTNEDLWGDKRYERDFYIPVKYLDLGYRKPNSVEKRKTLDLVVISKNASMYDDDGNFLACFEENIGPIKIIEETESGYFVEVGNNLIFIDEKDTEVLNYME